MSRIFTAVKSFNYIGALASSPLTICQPNKEEPRCVPLSIDWNVYWQLANNPSNVAVDVDMNAGAVVNKINVIKAVYIDNTGSTVPIYVSFPDTGFVVTAQPGATIFLPVLTNGTKCKIVAEGLTAGFIPQTAIVLCNAVINPFANTEINNVFPQWAGSPAIQRSNILTPGFAPPALGDQQAQYNQSMQVAGATTTILGTPRATGIFVITGLCVRFIASLANTGGFLDFFIESTGVSGTLYDLLLECGNNVDHMKEVYNQTGLQTKINATEKWQLRNSPNLTTGGTPTMQTTIQYSYFPNG